MMATWNQTRAVKKASGKGVGHSTRLAPDHG